MLIKLKFGVCILFIAGVLCTSCKIMIDFPIVEDPAIELDENAGRIAFINRYDYTVPGFDNEKQNKVFADGARQLIESLIFSFEEDELYDLIIVDTLARGLALNRFPEDLLNNDASSLCSKHNTDLLLLLEYFNAGFESEVVTEEYDDGSKSSTNYVKLVVEAGFSLYRDDGVLIDRKRDSRIQSYQDRPMLFSWIELGPEIGKAGKEVNTLAADIGYNYLDYFYPAQRMIKRQIYLSREFSEITPLMVNQQWDDAIELLMPLAHSPNPKLAKKAAHNLSVALEATGRTSDAVYWMNKANEE